MSLGSALLLAAGDKAAALVGLPDLDERIERLVATGRAALPNIALAPERFAAYVGERLPDVDPAAALDRLHAEDLYLACACAASDARALAYLEAQFMSRAALGLDRRSIAPALADEVMQVLRVRLLLSETAAPPRIASFTGRGTLRGWLRMTAARVMVDLERERGHPQADEQEIDRLESALADPEHAYLRADCRDAFAQALTAALAALTAREASMLKLHFLDGLGTAAIAGLDGVTERTARRWLAEIREKVLLETQRRLADSMSLTGAGLASLLALVESQLDLSLRHELSKR